MASLPGRGDPR